MGRSKALCLTFFLLLFTIILCLISSIDADGDDRSPPPSVNFSLLVGCANKVEVYTNFVPFNVSSLIRCFFPWSSRDFVVMYQQNGPSLWSFLLSTPESNGYISVGFSPTGKMIRSSAVAGWLWSNGTTMAKQYYLGGKKSGDCTPDQGDLQLVQGNTVMLSQSKRFYLVFQINTSQPPTKLIYALGPDGSLPVNDYYLPEHQDAISTVVDYGTGQSTAAMSDTLETSHWVLAMLGWGVLIPIGTIVARYCKHWDPLWYYSHLSIQTTGFTLGLAGIITGFKLEDKMGEEVDTHKTIGIVILVLGFLQITAIFLRPDKTAKVRRYWNWYHHNVGRAAIAFAISNIFYGLSLAEEDSSWSVGYGVFLGLCLLVSLFLEIRKFMKK